MKLPSPTRIHVNQHNIRSNKKLGTKLPAITVKSGKRNIKCNSVRIEGSSVVVYSPDKPLNCGARCWIETYASVRAIRNIQGKFKYPNVVQIAPRTL